MSVPLPSWSSVQPFLPEVVLVGTMVLGLLFPVFSPRRSTLGAGVLAAVGVFAAILALFTVDAVGAAGQATAGASYFGGLLVMDPFAWFLKLAILVFAFIIIALWAFTSRETFAQGDAPEFFTLLLAATVGMCLMTSTAHLLMMFMAVEMASLPSYVLAGFRKTRRSGAEAALKYVLFGAVCSAIMLYGMSLVYGLAGTLDLNAIAGQLLAGPAASGLLTASVVAILVGIGFKIAMVPVHFWAPDVFEGTHIDIAAFLSVASKAGGLALLLRVVMALVEPGVGADMAWLPAALLVLGAITCTWGNLAAFAQNNIKRLLAYSSIAHAGYMLLGMAIVVGARPMDAAEALLFYLFAYVFMNAGVFVAAAAIRQQTGAEDITGYAGLSRRSPVLAAAMVVFLFSLIGIPMTVGFGAKLKLFLVLFNASHWIGYAAVLVLGVNTVLAAFYYFRVIRQMYLAPAPEAEGLEGRGMLASLTPTVALAALLVVPNIGLFVAYSWLDDQSHTFSSMHAVDMTKLPAGDVASDR